MSTVPSTLALCEPISRGQASMTIRHTKPSFKQPMGQAYVRLDCKCFFSAPDQRRLRSIFIYQNIDRHGNIWYKFHTLFSISQISKNDPTKLVAPVKEFVNYRVNPRTGTCVRIGNRNYSQVRSWDDRFTHEEFKQLLLDYAQQTQQMLQEYHALQF